MPQPALRPAPAPVHRTGGRTSTAVRWSSRLGSGAVAALVAGALALSRAGVALAAPENPTDEQLGDARAAQDAAAAEVGRIAGLVAAAESQLEQVQVQAEAAGTAYLAAEEARLAADAAAEQTARDLQVAADAVTAAQLRLPPPAPPRPP